MTYSLRFSGKSRNHIRRLDQGTKRRIVQRIERLLADPLDPLVSEPMAARAGLRKSRVGLWRIVYEVDRAAGTVDILAVQPRGQVYRRV